MTTCGFFRFPHTPHISWLGDGAPRGDKVLDPRAADDLLSGEVLVEEKIDGANIGVSIGPDRQLRVQNRGQYLAEPYAGQFSRLRAWLGQRRIALLEKLQADWILFGEWCAARHSLDYDRLPDWFLAFDVYDRSERKFWSDARRDALAESLDIAVVPAVHRGKTDLDALVRMLDGGASRYRDGPPEGFVVRRQSARWCEFRAKLVRAEFAQAIDGHWRGRTIEWNRVA